MARPRAALVLSLLAAALSVSVLIYVSVSGLGRDESPAPAIAVAALPLPPEAVARAVALEVFVRGLVEPVAIAAAPGDASRLFVVEKGGRIRIVRGRTVAPEPFADLSTLVSAGSEQGLLGLAFHPRYAERGLFYVDYTDRKGDTRIVELRVSKADPDHADVAPVREILFIKKPYPNHNGGHLAFGPDGKLYVGTGDGGSGGDPHGNGQNRTSLLGKMLRLDLDTNPPVPEILQIGLRNPWRYAFDRTTGDLYIADVGQNHYEEVDVAPAGHLEALNFGWNIEEGAHCFKNDLCLGRGLTRPVIEYTHAEGCSITGGYVYRGKAIPEIAGLYFYADYCTALLRSFRWVSGRADDSWDWKPVLDPDGKLDRLTTFGEDADGELYLASQGGTIYRFVRAAR